MASEEIQHIEMQRFGFSYELYLAEDPFVNIVCKLRTRRSDNDVDIFNEMFNMPVVLGNAKNMHDQVIQDINNLIEGDTDLNTSLDNFFNSNVIYYGTVLNDGTTEYEKLDKTSLLRKLVWSYNLSDTTLEGAYIQVLRGESWMSLKIIPIQAASKPSGKRRSILRL